MGCDGFSGHDGSNTTIEYQIFLHLPRGVNYFYSRALIP